MQADLVARRLSTERKLQGSSRKGPMSQAERQRNMVMIVQIPLTAYSKRPAPHLHRHYPRHPHPHQYRLFHQNASHSRLHSRDRSRSASRGRSSSVSRSCKAKRKTAATSTVYSSLDDLDDFAVVGAAGREHVDHGALPLRPQADMEPAQVDVGPRSGDRFRELGQYFISRDARYPVRVTLQFYQSTSTGVVDENMMHSIASTLQQARGHHYLSSMVTHLTRRPTEPLLTHKTRPYHPIVAAPKPRFFSRFHRHELLHTKAYNGQGYICDRCSQAGTDKSYHCSICRFDLCSACFRDEPIFGTAFLP